MHFSFLFISIHQSYHNTEANKNRLEVVRSFGLSLLDFGYGRVGQKNNSFRPKKNKILILQ